MLPVVEIFESIDGEGIFAGKLATFIRLSGCNLRCCYCDTKYAYEAGCKCKSMSVEQIARYVHEYGCRHVTITGGEPLLHQEVKSLTEFLCKEGFYVNIETNGSLDISAYTAIQGCIVTMDWKTPYSGEESKMREENLSCLRNSDVLKLVMSEKDFDYVASFLGKKVSVRGICYNIFLSPVFGECEPYKLVDFLKNLKCKLGCEAVEPIRVQLQLHKFIWSPETRGV